MPVPSRQPSRCRSRAVHLVPGRGPLATSQCISCRFNKNSFGAVPESPTALGAVLPPQIAPGQSATGLMPLAFTGAPSDSKGMVQMAIKNNVKVYYFQDALDVLLFLSADGRLDRPVFLEQWKGIPTEARTEVSGLTPQAESVEAVCPKMEATNVFFVARRKTPDGAWPHVQNMPNAHLVEHGPADPCGRCGVPASN